MPLQMHFVREPDPHYVPAACCDVCSEPLTEAAPGCWCYTANRDGHPTPTTIRFCHDGDCRKRLERVNPNYTFEARPLADLQAALL